VRGEYHPVRKSEAAALSIEKIYQDTQLDLQEWSQLYAKQAYHNHDSYRKAAEALGVDQRTLKKWVVSA
jgi:transposase-like protein